MNDLLNESWSDYEVELMFEFPDIDILLSFVPEDKRVDFCHNLFDIVYSYKQKIIEKEGLI